MLVAPRSPRGVAVSALALLFGARHPALARRLLRARHHRRESRRSAQLVTNFEPWGGATGIYLSLDAYGPLGGPMQALWIIYLLIVAVMAASLLR